MANNRQRGVPRHATPPHGEGGLPALGSTGAPSPGKKPEVAEEKKGTKVPGDKHATPKHGTGGDPTVGGGG